MALKISSVRGADIWNSNRSTRSAPPRSRTLVYGYVMTRGPGHTICTRSTERCPERRQQTRSTKIWQRGIELDLGRFTYDKNLKNTTIAASSLHNTIDPQSCRNREDGRCQAPILETTSGKESEIPTAAPCRQDEQQVKTVRRSSTINFRIGVWCNSNLRKRLDAAMDFKV